MPRDRLTYRPDIDGLRAVAVLLVVFDHLHTTVTGGYIGVDVFFVISGYLISSVILSEMNSGSFSVINFYERRIRRIFPALLAMLLGTAVLACLFLIPPEIEAFGHSLLAALFSVSNFLFWRQTGYFETASALKPLLHTWSLAVEEQFYIVFPLFLIAVRRWFQNQLRAAIWSIAAISLTLACICVRWGDPSAAFYLAPLRAWELLLGAVISQHYVPSITGTRARNFAAMAGLLLIVAPSFLYTPHTPFPGLAAIPPCIGAALIISAGETGPSWGGRLLSWRPVVFIGLISYSLYLWHWPILAFQKSSYILISAPQRLVKMAVFAASLIAAILSWTFVETPFRKGRFRPNRRTLFVTAGVAVTLTALTGVFMVASHGLQSRFPPETVAISRYSESGFASALRETVCFIKPKNGFESFNKSVCLADDPARRHYLLLGDSHAAHLYPGLLVVFPELNISQANTAACKPFLSYSTPPAGIDNYCVSMWKYIYRDYLMHHHVDAVLISGRWVEADFPELGRTVAWLQQQGLTVILFGPAVEFDAPLPRLLALSLRDGRSEMIDRRRSSDPWQTDGKLSQIARDQWRIRYISAYENLCEGRVEGCPVFAAPGVPLLFDTDHFTAQGSVLYARTMRALKQLP